MNNNTILAIVFLMAGTLLTIGVTSMEPAAYAGGDDLERRTRQKTNQMLH